MSTILEKGLEKNMSSVYTHININRILEETSKLIHCFTCTETKIQTVTSTKGKKK